jgi:hypothetical protein
MEKTQKQLEENIKEAIEIASSVMGIEGEHHKVWGLDQIVQLLSGDDYDNVVENFEADTGGKWDQGIEP